VLEGMSNRVVEEFRGMCVLTRDISGTERLDMLRSFCSHGLEHWGSDAKVSEVLNASYVDSTALVTPPPCPL
jgi:hypothetical protein